MSKIRYDGYYYSFQLGDKKNNHSHNYVLRFFNENNKVISESIYVIKENDFCFGNFFPEGNWFNENYEKKGNFEINENKIYFKIGNISYKGTILNEEEFELFSHSNINSYENTEIYKFIPFDVLKDIKDLDNL